MSETTPSRQQTARPDPALPPRRQRRAVVRDALGVGIAVGTLGISFGALAVVAGLSPLQASVLSLVLFSGASQFAIVGVIAAGGNPMAGAAIGALLGVRNGLYGLALSGLLRVRGLRRLVAAHLVIDESAAMALTRADESASRLAFWATGLSVFCGWNVFTVIGALGARALPDPTVLGLDVAAPAAFLALLAPRLRGSRSWLIAASAVAVALVTVPLLPAGLPVLVATLPAVAWGLRRRPTSGESA